MNLNTKNPPFEPGRLLEQIVTASTSRLLLEEQQETQTAHSEDEREYSEDGEEEVFEDGDEVVGSEEAGKESAAEAAAAEAEESDSQVHGSAHSSVAAVLTELSQVTSPPLTMPAMPQATRPYPQQQPRTAPTTQSPHMTATINSINALLQSHLNGGPSSSASHKVRLSGPIRANINIRHGVWAPRLRCRKRKNLHAKDGIWIHPACTLDHLVALVKSVLPDEFEWDAQASPLRYQAVNDQSLQSLKTVSGTVVSGQSLYSAFDLVRNRRSDGDNFILQLYVYGTWTVLLKPHLTASPLPEDDHHHVHNSAAHLQPPPKKKYQQAHYNQLQMSSQQAEEDNHHPSTSTSTATGLFSHMRINQNGLTSPANSSALAYTHPLAAHPPVTFLPTVTLEMKLNGTFLPVEVSRRSFIAAIRACSIPKPASPAPQQAESKEKDNSNFITDNSSNLTPPPSEA